MTSISKDIAVQLVNGVVRLDVSAAWHEADPCLDRDYIDCCYNNQDSCQAIYCCNKGEECCRGEYSWLLSCCSRMNLLIIRWRMLPLWVRIGVFILITMIIDHLCLGSQYCALASNGQIGCCPNGQICTGPVSGGGSGGNGGGGGNNGGGGNGGSGGNGGGGAPTTTSHKPTTTSSSTEVNTPTSEFAASSGCYIPADRVGTATPTTSSPNISIQPTPTAEPGYANVVISESNTQITWSSGWFVQTSICDSTQQSKITVTADEWFTFITSPYSSKRICVT